jgi:cell division cycle protein 37
MGHYETEIAMNNHLLKMLDQLIGTFGSQTSDSPEEVVMQALIQLSSADHSDAPAIPQGTPGYGQMLASLVDTIKKEIDEEKPDDKWTTFVGKLKEHREKLEQQTKDTGKKLEGLREEESAKITSDDVHEGFSVGHVNKAAQKPSTSQTAAPKKKTTQKVQAVEQLNKPAAPADQSISSGAEADIEEIAGEEEEEDAHIEPTALGREFAKIKLGEYQKCLQFIKEHPEVVSEQETDGLLIDAFNSQMAGKDVYAKQCVHQALLLQYCRQLGPDGVTLFFKR